MLTRNIPNISKLEYRPFTNEMFSEKFLIIAALISNVFFLYHACIRPDNRDYRFRSDLQSMPNTR
jgi:hypothetical protein